mgnify:CR=1 FL=1
MAKVIRCEQGRPEQCDKPAVWVEHLRLGGGYGQRPRGVAFYHYCAEHFGQHPDTDMSRRIGQHAVAQVAETPAEAKADFLAHGLPGAMFIIADRVR